MQLPKKYKGYLSLITIVLMVIAGVVSVSASHFFSADSDSNLRDTEGTKALFLAEAGIQAAGYYLLGDTIGNRVACNSISSQPGLSNVVTGLGMFDVDQVTSAYYVPTATLTSSINATTKTIPVSSTVGYANAGRLMIDREVIDYTAKTSNSFTNARRAAAGNFAASHASGSRVSQYQCSLDSVGSIPNATNPRVKRKVRTAYLLQEGWVVGSNSGSQFRISRWNRPAQTIWNNASISSSSDVPLRGISMLNHGSGWIVGDVRSSAFGILRYDPVLQTWQTATGLPNPGSNYVRDLWDVNAVSHNEAWAVGERSNHSGNSRRFTILKWTGAQWCLLAGSGSACTSATIPTAPPGGDRGRHLYGIDMLDTNNDGIADLGLAVGEGGYVLQYNGGTQAWSVVSTPTSNVLRAVSYVSSNEAWAIGNNKTLIRWNGSSWSSVSLNGSNVTLRNIEMVDRNKDGAAEYGWIVGDNGRVYTYNGSSWSSDITITSGDLYAIKSFGPNDVWAAGEDNLYFHYDGTNVNTFSSNWNETMYDMALIGPLQKYKSLSSWEEIFH